MRGLVVDLFAGGGGASLGIEAALGRPVDIAINHDASALSVHKANHPRTRHLEADIWEVRPRAAVGARQVDVLWASPDCTHFSIAKGDVPRKQEIRSLAWAVVRWAKDVRPRVIFLENVQEFRGWCPLGADGRPDKSRLGLTFRRWLGRLKALGYSYDYRVLDASLYGAPTRRKRLFVILRCDGQPIRWPSPTHGPALLGLQPIRTAAECIDWSLPCPSIFERKRPLAEKTLWRIAEGIRRFVLENPRPFIVAVNHSTSTGRSSYTWPADEPLTTVTASGRGHAVVAPSLLKFRHDSDGAAVDQPMPTVTAGGQPRAHRPATGNPLGLLAPTLIQAGYGEREGQAARALDLGAPLGTVVAGGRKHALVGAFLTKHFGGVVGQQLDEPAGTVTARDHHALTAATLVQFNHSNAPMDLRASLTTITSANHVAEVRAFLLAYYSSGSVGQRADRPLRTLTAKARMGLVTVAGQDYQIADIGMRMLEPHELLRAQFGRFADAYDMAAATTKAAKVRLIGNSVCPEIAEAIVRANLPAQVEAVA